MSRSHLSVYVPEVNAFAQKDGTPSRHFFEDCAVIDAKTLCVLASRGVSLEQGASLSRVLKNAPSPEELLLLLQTHSHLVLEANVGTLLLFGDHLQSTGLILGICLFSTPGQIHQALLHLDRTDFFRETSEQMHMSFDELTALCDRLSEIFYYTDRIFHHRRRFGIGPLSLFLSEFVGCRILHVDSSADLPALSLSDRARLTFYLICAMLTLRHHSAALQINNTQSALHVRDVSYVRDPKKPRKAKPSKPLFLSAECFFGVEWQEDKTALEVTFPLYGTLRELFANHMPWALVRISLTPQPENS